MSPSLAGGAGRVGVALLCRGGTAVGSGAGVSGPTAGLVVVPATLLRRYEGRLVPHRRAEGRGGSDSHWEEVMGGDFCTQV